jgi:hypothetical protein
LGRDFPYPSKAALWTNQPPVQALFAGGKAVGV